MIYHIVFKTNSAIVAKCSTLKGARRSRDKRDLEYGAYAFSIREIAADGSTRTVF